MSRIFSEFPHIHQNLVKIWVYNFVFFSGKISNGLNPHTPHITGMLGTGGHTKKKSAPLSNSNLLVIGVTDKNKLMYSTVMICIQTCSQVPMNTRYIQY